jgi:hypothetical protein
LPLPLLANSKMLDASRQLVADSWKFRLVALPTELMGHMQSGHSVFTLSLPLLADSKMLDVSGQLGAYSKKFKLVASC